MSHVFSRQPTEEYPVAVAGDGIAIVDREGRRYLDASGGAAVSCLGHSHPRVIAAKAQLDLLAFAHTSFFTSEPPSGKLVSDATTRGRAPTVGDAQITAVARRNGMAIATRDAVDFEPLGVAIIDPWQGP